jgi:hypothetical protein
MQNNKQFLKFDLTFSDFMKLMQSFRQYSIQLLNNQIQILLAQ